MNNTTVKVFSQDVATVKFSTANDLHYMVQTTEILRKYYHRICDVSPVSELINLTPKV